MDARDAAEAMTCNYTIPEGASVARLDWLAAALEERFWNVSVHEGLGRLARGHLSLASCSINLPTTDDNSHA